MELLDVVPLEILSLVMVGLVGILAWLGARHGRRPAAEGQESPLLTLIQEPERQPSADIRLSLEEGTSERLVFENVGHGSAHEVVARFDTVGAGDSMLASRPEDHFPIEELPPGGQERLVLARTFGSDPLKATWSWKNPDGTRPKDRSQVFR